MGDRRGHFWLFLAPCNGKKECPDSGDYDCWKVIYAPDLGMPRLGNKEAETPKGDAKLSMSGARRLMVKCPNLDGRQHKVYKSKAVLQESQVLTGLPVPVTYGRSNVTPESTRVIETHPLYPTFLAHLRRVGSTGRKGL
jgi:hypothetical protein